MPSLRAFYKLFGVKIHLILILRKGVKGLLGQPTYRIATKPLYDGFCDDFTDTF